MRGAAQAAYQASAASHVEVPGLDGFGVASAPRIAGGQLQRLLPSRGVMLEVAAAMPPWLARPAMRVVGSDVSSAALHAGIETIAWPPSTRGRALSW